VAHLFKATTLHIIRRNVPKNSFLASRVLSRCQEESRNLMLRSFGLPLVLLAAREARTCGSSWEREMSIGKSNCSKGWLSMDG